MEKYFVHSLVNLYITHRALCGTQLIKDTGPAITFCRAFGAFAACLLADSLKSVDRLVFFCKWGALLQSWLELGSWLELSMAGCVAKGRVPSLGHLHNGIHTRDWKSTCEWNGAIASEMERGFKASWPKGKCLFKCWARSCRSVSKPTVPVYLWVR